MTSFDNRTKNELVHSFKHNLTPAYKNNTDYDATSIEVFDKSNRSQRRDRSTRNLEKVRDISIGSCEVNIQGTTTPTQSRNLDSNFK